MSPLPVFQPGEILEASQLNKIVQRVEPAFARIGLSSDWTQTSGGGTVPLGRSLGTAGGLTIATNGIQVDLAGAYQVSLDAVIQQADATLWRTVTLQRNGVTIPDTTVDAALHASSAIVSLSLPLLLDKDDVITIASSASSAAFPSTWAMNRTRLSVVRL